MPLYAYRCKACDHVFEQNQRMSDAPLRHCPVCAGEVRRLISNVGVVFKGSGFYITDNRNGSANGSSAKKDGSGENRSGETRTADTRSGDTRSGEPKSEKSSSAETTSSPAKSTGTASKVENPR
jgi:putative FmdB family regulatory protein